MLKAALKLILVLFIFKSNAQVSTDTLIHFTGKIFSTEDSSLISANILYEKLPYYDDIGMAKSKVDGSFEVALVKGYSYNFSITKQGFEDFTSEIKIEGNGDYSLNQSENFYVESNELELIKLENLLFASGRNLINQISYAELNELISWLNKNPTIIIQLEGHTDFDGGADANMRLSRDRVIAVKAYLTEKGIKKNRILTKAFGGTNPITKERTVEGKAQNRRVEVRVIR